MVSNRALRRPARTQRFELNYGGPEVANVSVLFAFCGYRASLEEELFVLPPEVLEDHPVRVTMARYAAELADSVRFGDLFRLEAVDSLNVILASLRLCATAEYEVEV